MYEGGPKNNWNLNVARELEVVRDAPLGVASQHNTLAVCSVASVSVECYCCCGSFSKCLLGGLAIFMMSDNKEHRMCVKFYFLLGSVRSGSEQSLTENKTSRTLFVLYYSLLWRLVLQ
jgi:hypothetical protein